MDMIQVVIHSDKPASHTAGPGFRSRHWDPLSDFGFSSVVSDIDTAGVSKSDCQKL
jgi:hypothetical protein